MSAAKVFISYSWEDGELARSIAGHLKREANQVWVDCDETRGGDNLTERISSALDWCDTVVLIWTKSAQTSEWVKLEWTSAVALRKRVIPCIVGDVNLPAILASTLYVEFADHNTGLHKLKHALSSERPLMKVTSLSDASVGLYETAIQEIDDVARTLERGRSNAFYEMADAPLQHFDDGLDALVTALDSLIRQRGSLIGTGESIYGAPIVQNTIANVGTDEKARLVSKLLMRFRGARTYRERIPVVLILYGILENDMPHDDIVYSRPNREKFAKHLRDMASPEGVSLMEVVETMAGAISDCWV